ncbi:LysR family transcriptional regulator [Albidovulum sediminicola]|uniref:LysR family transcriptional regulator n=1 Tax=Albidovulum sediminicola TaxID=2984331 RepID=A0ABT2Z6K1_9RHOB|nr:LysR family transcriptional regulator [Defluviimonas sp. WL0075]MCV2866772.1 LysR family transcriptional regulator [Defluviimonas sp. WL0075]
MQTIPFSFRQIDYLLAVAETGSTAAAARRLNVSQPSISIAVAQFEAHFGAPMFLRHPGRGMDPTPFGRDHIARLKALRAEASALLSPVQDAALRLRLGVYSTLGPRYAPMLMRRFTEAHPGASVTPVEGDIETLSAAVRSGEIDMALVYDLGLSQDFTVSVLASLPPIAVLPPDHALATTDRIDLRALADDPLVLVGLPHSRGYFLSLFHAAGVHPRVAVETGSIEMLRALVANGFGVGLLATSLPYDRTYDGRQVVERPLAGTPPPSRVVLIRAADLRPSEAMLRFEAVARRCLAEEP